MMDVVTPPFRVNAWLAVTAFAVAALQLAIVPIFLLPQAEFAATVVVLLLSFSTPFVRALLHEAIHNRMVRKRVWNDRLARALSICSGASFDAMRLGHMTHHRFPRHALDRADIIEPGKSPIATSIRFYFGLLGWVYLRELLSSMVMLLPRRAINWVAEFALADDETSAVLHGALRRGLDRRLARIRLDMVVVILIYGTAFYLYGAVWPILIAAIAVRGLIVSLQDNVAHYATPAVVGAAAHNSRASRWASLFMLNQNLHGVHHDQPELPWHVLPHAFTRRGGDYYGGYFALLMKQFYGPLHAAAPCEGVR